MTHRKFLIPFGSIVLSSTCVISCGGTAPDVASTGVPQVKPSVDAAVSVQACVPEMKMPAPDVPWKNVDELCSTGQRGASWPGAIAPIGPNFTQDEPKYTEKIQGFLRSLAYRSAPYAWLHDANWRLTGEYEGCPPDGVNRGPHPFVRIYYSPEIIDWMCKYRRNEQELPNASEIPDGAMIIKEMIPPDSTQIARVLGTQKLWLVPAKDPSKSYDQTFESWTVMIKSAKASADGWYWGFYLRDSEPGQGNPGIWDRAAFAVFPYPGSDGKPVTDELPKEFYPTFWDYTPYDVQFPNYEFGNYCVYCHSSAQGQNTFASFTNILGQETQYTWKPTTTAVVDTEQHATPRERAQLRHKKSDDDPRAPFPMPRPVNDPLPKFTATFPELSPTYQEVWATRLPAHTYDHAESRVSVSGVDPKQYEFLTSDQCEGCHEAGGSDQLETPYMVERTAEGKQIDISPWAEWSASPMGLAGRDPIFYSQLELERNIARNQPELAKIRDCIDNTCLHCHGAPGARQYNIDTAGQGPKDDPCAAFLPPKAERRATDYDGKLFTEDKMYAWRDEKPEYARYGGLGRDGVDCTICHRISDVDLQQANLAKTFTGNFRVGPPDKLFGPFPNDESKDEIRPKPMQHALGITPEAGAQTRSSELCGTCHTIFLPVFDDRGKLAGASYEQTTYLEWLLSDFNTLGQGKDGGKNCQSCHMPHDYNGKSVTTGVANIQDTRYPKADFMLPAKDVDIPKRPYKRHSLYGLNAFLNAYVQQFPLLLGYRQQDYMNSYVEAPLITARESVLDVARTQTADVRADISWAEDALEARVTITSSGGHNLPSGVGFRRLIVEVVVLDEQGKPLWASGRTNEIGAIVAGTTSNVLATEFWQKGPDGLPFQPHHQVIEREDQAQIYEEISQNSSLEFTSSFIHRYWLIKDNRLRPRGWDPARVTDEKRREEYGDATKPGTGPKRHWWPVPKPVAYKNPQAPAIEKYVDTKNDPDYDLGAHRGTGLPGTDSMRYRIRLSAEQKAQAKSVRVTLYSQSAPPNFLQERFRRAAEKGAEKTAATRLYYMAGHINTTARAGDGKPYLEDYRLRVGSPVEVNIPKGGSR